MSTARRASAEAEPAALASAPQPGFPGSHRRPDRSNAELVARPRRPPARRSGGDPCRGAPRGHPPTELRGPPAGASAAMPTSPSTGAVDVRSRGRATRPRARRVGVAGDPAHGVRAVPRPGTPVHRGSPRRPTPSPAVRRRARHGRSRDAVGQRRVGKGERQPAAARHDAAQLATGPTSVNASARMPSRARPPRARGVVHEQAVLQRHPERSRRFGTLRRPAWPRRGRPS